MEVFFTLLAERYERKSVAFSSNLKFKEWDQIFKDPMMAAAAADRIVHHSVLLNFTGPSYRAEVAERRAAEAAKEQRKRSDSGVGRGSRREDPQVD
jgi:DNA replication protein DnaC